MFTSVVGFLSFAEKLPVKAGDNRVTAKSENAFGIGAEYKS